MMTPERLAEIKARAEAATPGPWEHVEGPPGKIDYHQMFTSPGYSVYKRTGNNVELCASYTYSKANGEFIAHAITDVPDLCAEVERLRAENEELRDDVPKYLDRIAEVHKEKAITGNRYEIDALRAKLARIREAADDAKDKWKNTQRLKAHGYVSRLCYADKVNEIIRDLAAAIEEDE